MIFFPSGINDAPTAAMARAVSEYVLVDPIDKPNAQPYFATWHTALDSGGYRYFKAGQPITDAILLAFMTAIHDEDVCYPYLLHFALDQIGDADRTRELFRWQHNYDKRISPVYPWGAPRAHLDEYMALANTAKVNLPNGSIPLVGIGGLAPLLRGGHRTQDPAEKRRLNGIRDRTLDEVAALCREFPATFHILGLNALAGIDRLRDYAASADSSKWLDGGRYGYVFFRHTKTGALTQAPAKAIPEYAHLDRTQRCQHNLAVLIASSGPQAIAASKPQTGTQP